MELSISFIRHWVDLAIVRAAIAAAVLCLASLSPATAQPSPPPRFDIVEFRVEGNTVLDVQLIERAVYAFMGEGRNVDDVENARATLEAVYRQAGYGTVVVDTPEQRVVDGVITLQVREAPVSRLRVVGAKYFSQDRIVAAVPGLAEGQVPNFKQVSEQLGAVNNSADRRVTPLLRPGKTAGTTEVELSVEDKLPLHGSLELNNRQSPNTTATRLQGALRYDNLWQRQHSVGLQWQVSPENTSEVRVLSASYTVPLGRDLLVFSALRSDSSVFAGVGDTNVLGKGSIVGLRYIRTLQGSDALFHTATLGADHKDFKENVRTGLGTEAATGFSTPIRYLPLSANYAATLTDASGRWQAGAGLVLALRGLVSDEAQFEDKRFGGQGNFSLLKFDVSRTQQLPQGMTLFGRAEAQLASQPLIGNEQFVAGGASSVRGYLEASAVGDNALRGSLELRAPPVLAGLWGVVESVQFQGFADAALLRLKMPLPGQASHARLLGAGLGLTLRSVPVAGLAPVFTLEAAWPLRKLGSTDKGDTRLHASGAIEF